MNGQSNGLLNLQSMIAHMPGIIYWKNQEGIYLGCNHNAAKLIHLSSSNDLIGKTLYDIVPKTIADAVTRTDNLIMSSRQTSCIEEEGLNLNGQKAIYLTRKMPLENEKGEIIGLSSISIDITKRDQYKKMLKIAREQAKSAHQAKYKFILNMHHDLRTPFSGILSLSQFLEKKESDPKKKMILSAIVESTQNLLAILNKILHLISLKNHSYLKTTHFNLKTLANNFYKTMLPSTQSKGLELILNIDPALPERVVGNEQAIEYTLLNLVSNAIKFTNNGSISITLSNKVTLNKECLIEIKIHDTGCGIPKNKQEIIFEKFTKLTPSYKEQDGGMGLGLWLVKQLLSKMKGTIQLESIVGQGSTFICTFPILLED